MRHRSREGIMFQGPGALIWWHPRPISVSVSPTRVFVTDTLNKVSSRATERPLAGFLDDNSQISATWRLRASAREAASCQTGLRRTVPAHL